jgi:hypothetical protein
MTTSLVGRIRINSAISARASSEFSRFRNPSFDKIEIHDSSIPNDPSPPSKAAALLHRSELILTDGTKIPCISVLSQRVFDYNNRDFQAFQLQTLVDSISDKWLNDQGGGIQLSFHRMNEVGWIKKSVNKPDIDIFAKGREIRDHRIFKIFNLFSNNIGRETIRINESGMGPSDSIMGLSDPLASYEVNECKVNVIRKQGLRILIQIVSGTPTCEFISSILMTNRCIEAILVCDHGLDQPGKLFNAVAVTYRTVNYNLGSGVGKDLVFHSEFPS